MLVVPNKWGKGKEFARYYNWFTGLKPDWCDCVIFTGEAFKIHHPVSALKGKLKEFNIEFIQYDNNGGKDRASKNTNIKKD